jgi:signal transduction histidine kinase
MWLNYLLNTLGTVAAIAGVVSVIFGILVSRNLTAPLNRLANAARAIEARKLHRRVKVEGTTEIAAVAQAFNDMADSVQQATMLRQNLVADVAHELRTPLSVLQGNLRAIIDDVYPMSKQEISRLYDQTRLLSRLVNDLHELSQAEAHQLTLYPQPFDLAAMLHEQAGIFAALAEDEGLHVKIEAPASGVWIEADQARLAQVLNNLLANALAHTPAEGCIRVCLKAEYNTISLTVSDTGEGIEARHLPYLFERFYRVDTGRSRSKGGAGLGLAIVRALVQEHGGTIEAYSAGAGQGSTFTIRLPGALPEHAPAQ